MRKLNEDMKKRLDIQIEEKRARQQQEHIADLDFHKGLLHRVKQEEETEKIKHEIKRRQNVEFQNNLLLQMGTLTSSVHGSSVGSPSSVVGSNPRKRVVMETMTAEELRLNRSIIKEISQRKKERLLGAANLQTINE